MSWLHFRRPTGAAVATLIAGLAIAGPADGSAALPVSGAPGAPVNVALPQISGSPAVGATLTATTGSFTAPDPISYSYQWYLCHASCIQLPEGTGPTTSPVLVEIGWSFAVAVTATDAEGSTTAVSALTAPMTGPPGLIHAWLLPLVSALGKPGRLSAIATARGYTADFQATIPGSVAVTWTATQRQPGTKHSHTVVVARTSTTTKQPATSVKLSVTPAGEALLKSVKRLTVQASASFTYAFGSGTRTERMASAIPLSH